MKQIFYLLCSLLVAACAQGQTTGNEILGKWWNQEKDAQIEVSLSGSTYSAKVVWMKTPNDANGKLRTDIENPDATLRSRTILNLVFMTGFKFDSDDKEWSGGKIYDARAGKTYKCFLSLNSNGSLKVRGYIGASWMGLGKTNTWTRVQ